MSRACPPQDDLSYLREFEHITLARVLLARSTSDRADRSLHEALGLLERLLHAAEAGERTGSVIEILVLQALAHQMHGDIPAALVPLATRPDAGRAGGLRPHLCGRRPTHGAPAAKRPRNSGIARSYCPSPPDRPADTAEGSDDPLTDRPLIEPLSDRELDVLRLLGTDLSGPDIARELMVSLNTLRTHTKNIYDKLGVNNRRAAVHRAEELDLRLTSPHTTIPGPGRSVEPPAGACLLPHSLAA